jgi:hypothetical protein
MVDFLCTECPSRSSRFLATSTSRNSSKQFSFISIENLMFVCIVCNLYHTVIGNLNPQTKGLLARL